MTKYLEPLFVGAVLILVITGVYSCTCNVLNAMGN